MEQAAKTLSQLRIKTLERHGKSLSENEIERIYEGIKKDYMEKSSAYHSTSELWDDGIIDPADTRNVLGIALSVSLNRSFKETPHGILRI
jgi:3-methylcrotonyl-CoA carboxylase beta subunit